jgi:hypothetical protein
MYFVSKYVFECASHFEKSQQIAFIVTLIMELNSNVYTPNWEKGKHEDWMEWDEMCFIMLHATQFVFLQIQTIESIS